MERREPALIPEWLRCSGSVTSGGASTHHFGSSSDIPSSSLSMRNRAFRSINDKDSPRSSFLDRSNSSNSRRNSSSNGFTKHPYSSFTRSHRDKNRDKEKERSAIRDIWDNDISDPLTSILGSRVENTFRRCQSMVSRKPGEVFPRRAAEAKDSGTSNQSSGNGMLSGASSRKGMQKVSFEKDFPSLGLEEKQGVVDAVRVSSPCLSTSVQSLPVGNSGSSGSEGWTSALAEVPAIIGSSITGTSSIQQSVIATPASGNSSSMGGLNMAETLSQAPSRVHMAPQLPDKIQRLEELAIKQSRQLIPMTPSTPKPLVLNSSDKLKQPKTTVRTSETISAAKSAQQQPCQSQSASNQSLRGVQVRPDTQKTSHSGKFLVLKPVWENGVPSIAKDVSCTTNNLITKVANSQVSAAPLIPAVPLSTPSNPIPSTIERKAAAVALNQRSIAEKRASLSQAQSRTDFFNLMRKKTSVNSSSAAPNSNSTLRSSGEIKEAGGAPESPSVTENADKMASNGDSHEESHEFSDNVEKNLCLNGSVYPDEEEAAFLRSLGWEENAGEDEGLTEEEINAFYQEYMKLKPASKACRGLQHKISMVSDLN